MFFKKKKRRKVEEPAKKAAALGLCHRIHCWRSFITISFGMAFL